MLERFKDWKTTVPALLIGGAIVGAMLYAMRARPEWGIPELVAFGGGVATIIVGALTRSAPADAAPKAPAVPPLPALLALALLGCASPLDSAIRATNASREAGVLAHDTIQAVCLPAYRTATRETLPATEAACGPALAAYRVYARAHVVAVVAVQRAELGLATEAQALAAAVALGRASVGLVAAVQAVAP